jgi:hypothetical protein
MRQMREALPIVWWKALCFHYVRRTRQVTRYRNGDAFTSTQVYYERVNSHTAGCAFNFTNCGFKDNTKIVTGLEDYPATKIRFSKSFTFLHEDAKYEFDDQRNQFFTENERRDDYMETREGMDLLNVNFKEHMMAFKDPDNLPWYVSNAIFWIASFCLLSWPLRVIIEYKTAYIHYHVHKVFGTNYVNTDESLGSSMTRANTIGSAELEMIVRNNFSIVPSYSEALLMNVNATSSHTLRDANANVTSPILGPTRSVTLNNIASNAVSSGYITGFFSSATVQNIIHSTSNADHIEILSPVHSEFSLRTSLRNLLRSPWNSRRKTSLQSRNIRSNTMFMLSSPGSHDEYSLSVDQRLESANLSRNYLSWDDLESNSLRHHNERPLDNCDERQHDLVTGRTCRTNNSALSQVVQSNINETPACVQNNSIAARPCTIICASGDKASSWLPRPKFIKSNLPCVPINNILSESCSTVGANTPTPSSPPCYEQALSMQRPLPQTSLNNYQSENQALLSNNRSGIARYSTIMETSL